LIEVSFDEEEEIEPEEQELKLDDEEMAFDKLLKQEIQGIDQE